MNNQTKIFLGSIIVILIAGVLIFYHPQPKTQNLPQQEKVYVPPPPGPDQLPPSATVKITKTEGNKIYFNWSGVEKYVSVTSSTKLSKVTDVKGVFKEVTVPLSEIKAGSLVEITFGQTAASAVSIKLLQ